MGETPPWVQIPPSPPDSKELVRVDEVVTELQDAKRERKDDPLLIHFLGMVYAAQRKHAEALGIIKELEGISGAGLSQAHYIAKIYATMNEKELAFSWLERGLAARAIAVFYKDDPVWDPIRNDPRFADLLRRMGHSVVFQVGG